MKLIEKIKKDNLAARKNQDKFLSGILTTLIGEIEMIGKNDGNRESTDEEAMKVITKFKKGATSTLELMLGANTENEKIPKIQSEIEIYEMYLPKVMTEQELINIIFIWKETRYPEIMNFGGFMQTLKRDYPGQYDAKMASQILKDML